MFETIVFNLEGNGTRYENLEGRRHLVVPTVILAEGVLNGSGGAIFYPGDENAKSAPAWDHKPIVVYHPKVNGKYTSACKPYILNHRRIGLLLNTQADENKLRTESWLDVERTMTIDRRVIEKITANDKVEVSTGLNFDFKKVNGEHDGMKFDMSAHNYRPDHLAILPDQLGAYSVERGGGMLANVLIVNREFSADRRTKLADSGKAMPDGSFPIENEGDLKNAIRAIGRAKNPTAAKRHIKSRAKALGLTSLIPDDWNVTGNSLVTLPERTVVMIDNAIEAALSDIGVEFAGNDLSFGDVHSQLSDALASRHGEPGQYWRGFVHSVYPGHVIYHDGKNQMMAHEYANDGSEVKLKGKPIPVDRKVQYVAKDGSVYAGNASGDLVLVPTKEDKMAFDRKAHLTSLIGNGFAEDDRPWLDALGDPQLEKIKPREVAANKDDSKKDDKKVDPPPPDPGKKMTWAEIQANMDDETRQDLDEMRSARQAEKDKLVTVIIGNTQNVFTKEELGAKKLPELRKLAALAKGKEETAPTVNYGGLPGAHVDNAAKPVNGGGLRVPVNNPPSILDGAGMGRSGK